MFKTHLVNDGTLDALDANWLLGNAQNACTFARRWADTASELGEVVREQQTVERVAPLALEDEIVPLGDDVADRAAGVALAERHTTVHTTRRLNR